MKTLILSLLLAGQLAHAADLFSVGCVPVTAVAFATSATKTEAIATKQARMISLVLNKTGLGKGTVKLQGSVDGTTYKDINTTTYPDATATVGAGTASSTVSLIANPFQYIQYSFTEDGTNSGNIVSGKWCLK